MYPIYKFTLSDGETTNQAHPIYGDDLTKEFAPPSNEKFFRPSMTGELSFTEDDYYFILESPFDTEFYVDIYISQDGGANWALYWQGVFWKTDCKFDEDGRSVVVSPQPKDMYTNILDGMDKEYDLIELAPEIEQVKADKRPLIQIYALGESVVACFLSGMWWEQPCNVVEDENELHDDYHFGEKVMYRVVSVSGNTSPALPTAFVVDYPNATHYTIDADGFQFLYDQTMVQGAYQETYEIYQGNVLMWRKVLTSTPNPMPIPTTVTLEPQGSAWGTPTIDIRNVTIYGRLIFDVPSLLGVDFPQIPLEDIVDNNRNYHYCSPFTQFTIEATSKKTPFPTKWGIYQPKEYYVEPDDQDEYSPVARTTWGTVSFWLVNEPWPAEDQYRAPFTIRDAFPLWSAIAVLLGKIAPGITHEPTSDYSQFLYGPNFIRQVDTTLLIAPKSNIITAQYDQPAQRAMIRLRDITDMLRDCYRCYWFIDDEGRFRIEHIYFFMNGGSYTLTPQVGTDLTQRKVTRNNKAWAFARNQYTFDKPDMTSRYQFGWMDEVTEPFEGLPIDIEAKYVDMSKIEDVDVSMFTSDIDYIMLNPSEISKDGFVLMGATDEQFLTPDSSPVPFSSSSPRVISVSGLRPGEMVELKFSIQGSGEGESFASYILDASDVIVGHIGREIITSTPIIYTQNVIVPQGASKIRFTTTSSSASVQILSLVGALALPYQNFQYGGESHLLQNAYTAFVFLQRYYAYDMPARYYAVGEDRKMAYGVKRLKRQQITFPAREDLDLMKLIKTDLGEGSVNKLSINLSSRKATANLSFDVDGGFIPPTEHYLRVSPSSLSFPSSAQSLSLSIESNTEWTLTAPNFLTASALSGVGSALITLTSQDNHGGQLYGTIVIRGLDVDNVSVQVTQAPEIKYLNATPTSVVADPDGQSALITISSNTSWTLSIPSTMNWVLSSAYGGSGNSTFNLLIGQNETGQARSGVVTIIGDGVPNVTISISQQPRIVPFLSVSPNNRTYNSNPHTFYYQVTCNGRWACVGSTASWLHCTDTGTGNGIATIDLEQNNTTALRTGVLTFRMVDYPSVTFETTISQESSAPAVTTYGLIFGSGQESHLYPASGGNFTPSVYGVTYVNGEPTSSYPLQASALSFASSGDSITTRNGLTFIAADLGTNETSLTSQQWTLTWNAHSEASIVLNLSQEANTWSVIARESDGDFPYVPSTLVWNSSQVNEALAVGDTMTLNPTMHFYSSDTRLYTSGAQEVVRDDIYLAGTVLVSGTGLSVSGSGSSYIVTYDPNTIASTRSGSITIRQTETNPYYPNYFYEETRSVTQASASGIPSKLLIKVEEGGQIYYEETFGKTVYGSYVRWDISPTSYIYTDLTPSVGEYAYNDTLMTSIYGEILAIVY